MRPATLCWVLIVGCGAAAAEHMNPESPTASPTTSPNASVETTSQATAPEEDASRELLAGRFHVELPAAAQPAHIWPSEQPGYRDAWRVPYEDCDLFLAASSEGLARPDVMTLGEDETRIWVPSETAERRLEVITVPLRAFGSLGMGRAALGAVVFELDGNATDFFVWPDGPERAGFNESGGEDWHAWQRSDPALQACYASAERLLGEVLRSLRTQRPFQARPARLTFGWDDAIEDKAVFTGSLPEGWIITESDAFDAAFLRVHRRQDWSWAPDEPALRAVMWSFTGDDARPIRGHRETLFGYPLRFDDEGCARVVEPRMPFQQYLCLHGSRAEKRELVRVLRSFVREPSPQ